METSTQTNRTTTTYTVGVGPLTNLARRLALLAIVAGVATACSVRKIKDPLTGAVIYESHRFGNAEKFDSITATYVDKHGNTNTICIKGYISDQVAGMKAAFEGAGTLVGKAAATAAKP